MSSMASNVFYFPKVKLKTFLVLGRSKLINWFSSAPVRNLTPASTFCYILFMHLTGSSARKKRHSYVIFIMHIFKMKYFYLLSCWNIGETIDKQCFTVSEFLFDLTLLFSSLYSPLWCILMGVEHHISGQS